MLAGGSSAGSVSGGCLEEDIAARGRRVLASGVPELAVYDTAAENDLVWGTGLGCQGVVRVLLEKIPVVRPRWIGTLTTNLRERRATGLVVDFGGSGPAGTRLAEDAPPGAAEALRFRETITPPPALLICGAGDDAQPLARLAQELGWHITVEDPRAALVTRVRFPAADRLQARPIAEFARDLVAAEPTLAVVMSHRYADDLAYLRALLPRDLSYVGQLGPRSRTDRLLRDLAAEGYSFTAAGLAKLHAPVGLDLGGDTPETVALAIVAEMQAHLTARAAGFLRDRTGPIHEPARGAVPQPARP
jgi:xanthine/CO dehydrogenase XdhC/CoxF family maturation factor